MTGSNGFSRLLEKQSREGSWVCVTWLIAYCIWAGVSIFERASHGKEYAGAFFLYLIPALVAYAEFRYPTILGWLVMFLLAAASAPMLLDLGFVAIDAHSRVRGVMILSPKILLVAMVGTLLGGFIRYRPFWRRSTMGEGAWEQLKWKFALWLFFAGLGITCLGCWLVATQLPIWWRVQMPGRPLPSLSRLLFYPTHWLLFCPVPWLVYLLWLSFRKRMTPPDAFIFVGTIFIFLGILFPLLLLGSLLPYLAWNLR